jgi:hypothetical protein
VVYANNVPPHVPRGAWGGTVSKGTQLQVNITKPKFSKWPLLRFVEVTDKEISEIKLNSVPKK